MKIQGLRWWVVGLIALAAVINYIDRQTLGVLWPEMSVELFPDKTIDERKQIYANIGTVFIFAYAFGQFFFGKIFDWVGTRFGFVLSIGVWSLATAAHAFAKGAVSFSIVRAILGVAEAGNWPGAAKGNAEWFPAKQRALAQGIFNSGAAIGGMISIPLIALLSIYMSWQMIFVTVGLVGMLWLIPWMVLVKAPPEKHPWITEEEREFILTGQKKSDKKETVAVDHGYNPSTGEMLTRRESWGAIISSAAVDPIWWLFVVWIPIYLSEVYGMDVKTMGIYGWVPYAGAALGAWFGGLLSQSLMKKGWNVDRTRKVIITLGCTIMLPMFVVLANPGSPVLAVLIMAIILFGFQTSIGSIQTLPSDLYGRKSIGTLAGLAGMAAKLGAAGLNLLVPWLTSGGNYTPAFLIGAGLAVTAAASIWILCPKIEKLKPKTV